MLDLESFLITLILLNDLSFEAVVIEAAKASLQLRLARGKIFFVSSDFSLIRKT